MTDRPNNDHGTNAAHDRKYVVRKDYADDPFKAMARHYDAAVVAKGDTTIFGPHRRPVLTAAGDHRLRFDTGSDRDEDAGR